MAKDPFASLDEEFKAAVPTMTSEDIKRRVADIALELDRLLEAKKEDQDLQKKLEAAKEAGAIYREGQKGARLRIRFAQTVLQGRAQAESDR